MAESLNVRKDRKPHSANHCVNCRRSGVCDVWSFYWQYTHLGRKQLLWFHWLPPQMNSTACSVTPVNWSDGTSTKFYHYHFCTNNLCYCSLDSAVLYLTANNRCEWQSHLESFSYKVLVTVDELMCVTTTWWSTPEWLKITSFHPCCHSSKSILYPYFISVN